MNPSEILRLVDSLHREKDIDAEVVFQGIEAALLSAARKHFGASESVTVTIDRETGQVDARDGDEEIDPSELGRDLAKGVGQVLHRRRVDSSTCRRNPSGRTPPIVTPPHAGVKVVPDRLELEQALERHLSP